KHDNSSKRDRGFVRLADYFVAEAKSGTDTSGNLFSRGCMLDVGRRRLIDSPGVPSLYAAIDGVSAIFDNVDAIDRGRLGAHGSVSQQRQRGNQYGDFYERSYHSHKRFCSQVDLNTATAVQSQARQPLYPADDDPAFLAAAVQKYGWGYLSRYTKQGTEWRIASARGKPGHHRERVSGETARGRHYRIDARGTRSPARCVRCGGDPQGGTARDFAWEPAFNAGHTMLAAPLNLHPLFAIGASAGMRRGDPRRRARQARAHECMTDLGTTMSSTF